MPEREWDATTYDRVADPQARWGAGVLERLEPEGVKRVLDAGCGSGRVTQMLLDALPAAEVVALDGSQAMVDAASERLSSYGARVSFVCADLLALTTETIGGEPVDAVLSTATFHWITDHESLFRRIHDVLVPGGQLVAQCGGQGNIASLIAAVNSLGVERVGSWEYADVDTTTRRLEAAGFDVAAVWLNPEPTPFDPGQPFEDFLETVCLREHVATMPAADRRDFVHQVAEAMTEPLLDYVRLNILARRR